MKRFSAMIAVAATAALSVPAGAQHGPAGVIEVPLEVQNGRLIVPVMGEDGTRFDFILSTYMSSYSAAGAHRIGDQALTVGGVSVITEEMLTQPDSQLTFGGKTYDGVLGSRTLSEYDLLIDAPNGRLLLKEPGTRVAWDGVRLSDPVPLRVFHGMVLAMDVELDGTEYPAMFDVGMGYISPTQPVKRALSLHGDQVGSLQLGDVTYTNLPLRVLDMETIPGFDPRGTGFVFVGAPIATDCAVSVSFRHAEMRMCVR